MVYILDIPASVSCVPPPPRENSTSILMNLKFIFFPSVKESVLSYLSTNVLTTDRGPLQTTTGLPFDSQTSTILSGDRTKQTEQEHPTTQQGSAGSQETTIPSSQVGPGSPQGPHTSTTTQQAPVGPNGRGTSETQQGLAGSQGTTLLYQHDSHAPPNHEMTTSGTSNLPHGPGNSTGRALTSDSPDQLGPDDHGGVHSILPSSLTTLTNDQPRISQGSSGSDSTEGVTPATTSPVTMLTQSSIQRSDPDDLIPATVEPYDPAGRY